MMEKKLRVMKRGNIKVAKIEGVRKVGWVLGKNKGKMQEANININFHFLFGLKLDF